MYFCSFFFFQAEDGIRDLVRSRGLGDVYKRQRVGILSSGVLFVGINIHKTLMLWGEFLIRLLYRRCLLYTSDAADERSSVDLGGRRIINKKIKKKKNTYYD